MTFARVTAFAGMLLFVIAGVLCLTGMIGERRYLVLTGAALGAYGTGLLFGKRSRPSALSIERRPPI